jgi:ubiquinone/menaquinone biosynthesis C-methylase UbiE/DNA-binding transcriptional ArsR family regulator
MSSDAYDAPVVSLASAVGVLKAAAEPTRLRVLALLAHGELNVKDLTRILGQSQPRISRHLKLLTETGLVERAPEGSWVYFRLASEGHGREVAQHILDGLSKDDPALVRDRRRAEAVKAERQDAAQTYFQAHAGDWDRIRALHAGDADVEHAVSSALGPGPFNLLVDLGTGTGRMLELFAPRYRRGIGLDLSPAMLAYARANLERAGLSRVQVRQGDICDLPLADRSADAVVMHQVLHFLSDPQPAIREASRVLAPGGRLLIVDFAPHELEFLREEYAHQRLGFARPVVAQWLGDLGLEVLETRDLPAADDGKQDKLTVSLWLAGRAPAAARTEASKHNLERIG